MGKKYIDIDEAVIQMLNNRKKMKTTDNIFGLEITYDVFEEFIVCLGELVQIRALISFISLNPSSYNRRYKLSHA